MEEIYEFSKAFYNSTGARRGSGALPQNHLFSTILPLGTADVPSCAVTSLSPNEYQLNLDDQTSLRKEPRPAHLLDHFERNANTIFARQHAISAQPADRIRLWARRLQLYETDKRPVFVSTDEFELVSIFVAQKSHGNLHRHPRC